MIKRLLIPVLAVVTCIFALQACGDKKAGTGSTAPLVVPVNTSVVHPEKAFYYDQFPGTVVAMMQVDIRAEAEGYVTGIFFTEGAHVTKGQKLYTIDDKKTLANNRQAEANVKVAESNYLQARRDADRYIYLDKHEAVAKQVLEHAQTALQNAREQLAAAKQEQARTETDLIYSTVTAPFDGTIGISQVKVGNTVVRGQTIFNTVSTNDPMAVDILVNEKQISRFLALQRKSHAVTDSIFTLVLPDNSIYDQVGRIQTIDRGVNPQTGTIVVRLVFPNSGMTLRTGMSCAVRVKSDDTSMRVLVPQKAIHEQMGENFVYVVKDTVLPAAKDKGKEAAKPVSGYAVQRKVKPGQTVGGRVIILSGLEDGDNVVTDGVQKLHDGTLIYTGEQKK